MKSLKISVIVPVYNAAHVLKRCLEYLVHQTYKNLEIIVVDDGSPDNSADIYSIYAKKDKRIKIIKQKNGGPATARNTGIKAATGDYIHFCDSDDFVNLDYYERMAEAATITDADIICGNVKEKGFIFPEFYEVNIFSDLKDKIAVTRAYDFNVVWRFLYKRKFLNDNKILFPMGMYWGEDAIFMNKALYYSSTLATARGAVYNCINNPISLGKNIKAVLKDKGNGSDKDYENYLKFLSDTGLKAEFDNMRKKGRIYETIKLEFLKIPVWSVQYFYDGSKKLCVFGIPFINKKITTTKVRYYIFGLYLFRIYAS